MRFTPETHPKGTIRYKKRFAFVPVKIGRITVWLESYYVKQEWSEETIFTGSARYETGTYCWRIEKKLLKDDVEVSPLSRALE